MVDALYTQTDNVTNINNQETIINSSIDQLLENLPVGSIRKAIGNNLYGINMTQSQAAVPSARDAYGFTFFTRPQLNLSIYNLSNYRGFYNLLTDNALSYQRYCRLMLDPRIAIKGLNNQIQGEIELTSPFVDIYNPFIPILTNNIVSLSGWPDMIVPTRTSDTGLYGEEHSTVDGVINNYESFDIDATFRNTRGNPLIYMFYTWIKYQTFVYEGILNLYPDFITENEIDYQTRIYRLVLDQQKKYVTYIAATGASFPLNVPIGSIFDFSVDDVYNNKNKEINIRFKSNGFTAFEDILKYEFNATSAIFNPDLRTLLEKDMDSASNTDNVLRENKTKVYTNGGMSRIPPSLAAAIDTVDLTGSSINKINHRAIPWINLHTNELEWWVKSSDISKDMTGTKNTRGNKNFEQIITTIGEATGIIDSAIRNIKSNAPLTQNEGE